LMHSFFANMGGFTIEISANELTQISSSEFFDWLRLSRIRTTPHPVLIDNDIRKGVRERWSEKPSHEIPAHDLTSRPQRTTMYPNASQIETLLQSGVISEIAISREQIKAKSQSKGWDFSTVSAFWHVLYLVYSIICQRLNGVVTSQIEVTAAAYAVYATIIYVLWWDKPQSVEHSIALPVDHGKINQETLTKLTQNTSVSYISERRADIQLPVPNDVHFEHVRSIKLGWPVKFEINFIDFGLLCGDSAFGMINVLAWWSAFPSAIEQKLWICAAITTICALPVLAVVTCIINFFEEAYQSRASKERIVRARDYSHLLVAFYVLARLYLWFELGRILVD